MASVPVWAWLPGATEPVEAATLEFGEGRGLFRYADAYRGCDPTRELDPVHLPFSRRMAGQAIFGNGGFPGVIVDAMPSGYGEERLNARARRELAPLELLAAGPGDAAGGIEVCEDIRAKADWRPEPVERLLEEIRKLEEGEPHSRALRRLQDDGSTSAGGERPKVTLQMEGCQWLAKLQAKGDLAWLPAREYAAMNLARDVGIEVPATRLLEEGGRQVFLVQRFDRAGDPGKPRRHLFASAHSVLGLDGKQTRDDPRRSYLVLADEMRKWQRASRFLDGDLRELWRRMVFNILVGNSDDHPRNHALIHAGEGWRLSPAFDITPLTNNPGLQQMAVDEEGGWEFTLEGVLRAAPRFGYGCEEGAAWLLEAARHVADNWRGRLAASNVPDKDQDLLEPAFSRSAEIARNERAVLEAAERARAPKRRNYRKR